MSKFNTGTAVQRPRSMRGGTALKAASATPDTRTHEGALAFSYDSMTELFMLLSGSFITEDAFYETGEGRMARVRELVQKITANDESEDKAASGAWFAAFTKWLRTKAFIRTGAVVLACEVTHARQVAKAPGFSRECVDAACDRGDEPGELVGYWLATFGKTIPIAVKRGLADAVVRLYSEYSTLRYDTGSHAIRFGDVVELVQPATNARASAGVRNDDLLRHLIDRRHDYNTNSVPESLSMIRARAELDALDVAERRAVLLATPERLKAAGMSWETLAGMGAMDAAAWKAIIPTMGYMALLRNLRNFDQQGVSTEVAAKVAARIGDPEQVAKSRQLPFRFWTAYREIDNDRWKVALGDALDAAVQNIPDSLRGNTLVLVDTSASMRRTVSEKSSVSMQEIGALFGVAMGMKFGVDNVTLAEFASLTRVHALRRGASVLSEVERFNGTGRVGHGTEIEYAVRTEYNGHDRVVLFSDMQTWGSYADGQTSRLVPAHVPFYAFNLAGYGSTVVGNEPNRFQLGGLSDKTFAWMESVERGVENGWPWETEAV